MNRLCLSVCCSGRGTIHTIDSNTQFFIMLSGQISTTPLTCSRGAPLREEWGLIALGIRRVRSDLDTGTLYSRPSQLVRRLPLCCLYIVY